MKIKASHDTIILMCRWHTGDVPETYRRHELKSCHKNMKWKMPPVHHQGVVTTTPCQCSWLPCTTSHHHQGVATTPWCVRLLHPAALHHQPPPPRSHRDSLVCSSASPGSPAPPATTTKESLRLLGVFVWGYVFLISYFFNVTLLSTK